MSETLVLDACAVVAYLLDEPGSDEVESALAEAEAAGVTQLMTAVNWSEVLYTTAREQGEEDLGETIVLVDALPIGLVDAGRDLATQAAHLKHEYGIGLADAFAAALAMSLGLPLMTKDPDFDPLADIGLELRQLS